MLTTTEQRLREWLEIIAKTPVERMSDDDCRDYLRVAKRIAKSFVKELNREVRDAAV